MLFQPERQVVAGIYASRHSYYGQPTPEYVRSLIPIMAAQPRVTGVSVYTLKGPPEPAREPSFGCKGQPGSLRDGEMGCIVMDVFSGMVRTSNGTH